LVPVLRVAASNNGESHARIEVTAEIPREGGVLR